MSGISEANVGKAKRNSLRSREVMSCFIARPKILMISWEDMDAEDPVGLFLDKDLGKGGRLGINPGHLQRLQVSQCCFEFQAPGRRLFFRKTDACERGDRVDRVGNEPVIRCDEVGGCDIMGGDAALIGGDGRELR